MLQKIVLSNCRKINKVSIVELTQDISNGLCIAKCKVQDKDNRFDIATGAVAHWLILKAENLQMHSYEVRNKGKRRA